MACRRNEKTMMMRVNDVRERMIAVPNESAVRTRNSLTAVDPPPAMVCRPLVARLASEGAEADAGMARPPDRTRRGKACGANPGLRGFRTGDPRTHATAQEALSDGTA